MRILKVIVLAGVLSSLVGCKRPAPPAAVAPPPVASAANQIVAAQAIAEKTPSFENYTSLGLLYSNAGRHEEALKAFLKTTTISPKSSIAFNNVCYTYNVLKRWALGIENCQKALQLEPNFTLAKNNLTVAQRSKDAQEARIAELKKVIKSGKDSDKNQISLGMEYYSEGAYDSAVDSWKQVSKDSSVFATAQNNLASAYIVMKKFDLAKTHLDKALEIDPKNQLYLNNRQWLQSVSQEKAP